MPAKPITHTFQWIACKVKGYQHSGQDWNRARLPGNGTSWREQQRCQEAQHNGFSEEHAGRELIQSWKSLNQGVPGLLINRSQYFYNEQVVIICNILSWCYVQYRPSRPISYNIIIIWIYNINIIYNIVNVFVGVIKLTNIFTILSNHDSDVMSNIDQYDQCIIKPVDIVFTCTYA